LRVPGNQESLSSSTIQRWAPAARWWELIPGGNHNIWQWVQVYLLHWRELVSDVLGISSNRETLPVMHNIQKYDECCFFAEFSEDKSQLVRNIMWKLLSIWPSTPSFIFSDGFSMSHSVWQLKPLENNSELELRGTAEKFIPSRGVSRRLSRRQRLKFF
jgi:hypothetical protein